MAYAVLYQFCDSRGRSFRVVVGHSQELYPVVAEALRVDTGVDDQAPEERAAGFVPQGEPGLALRHVVADVD